MLDSHTPRELFKRILLRTLLFSIILLFFKFAWDNFDDIIDINVKIRKIPVKAIITLLSLQILTQFLLSIQWYKISKAVLGKSSFFKTMYILMTGSIIEAITPGAKIGGEATRLYYIKKMLGAPTTLATNIIIIQKSISMSVLFSVCLASFVYLSTMIAKHFSIVLLILITLLCIFIILFMLGLLFFTSKLINFLENYSNKYILKPNNWVKSYNNSVSMLSKKQWVFQFLISFLVWTLFPMKMFILTSSLSLDMNFFVVLAITMTSYMIGTLPITPGGIGTFEGSMITLFSIIYGNNNNAISTFATITIVFRGITFWFVIFLSFIFVMAWKLFEREN